MAEATKKKEQEQRQDAPKQKATASREERLRINPGMAIRIHQRITDVSPDGKERERTQVFEGLVLSRHGGHEAGATMTVRKMSEGVGVEKIFPLFLPTIEKIEFVREGKVRRANVSFLRTTKKKVKERKKR